jgi:hypothetical protein
MRNSPISNTLLGHMAKLVSRNNSPSNSYDLYEYCLERVSRNKSIRVKVRFLASAIVFYEKYVYDKHCERE